jgi:ribonuclease Y
MPWLLPALYWITGVAFGYVIHSIVLRMQFVAAQQSARNLLDRARAEAEDILREGKIQAKDEMLKAREQFEKDCWTRRQDLMTIESRIDERERALDKRVQAADRKEHLVDERLAELDKNRDAMARQEEELKRRLDEQRAHLEKLAGLSAQDARQQLLNQLDTELRDEAGALIRRVQEDAKSTAEKEARKIITVAIERYAASQTNEMTTCTVHLPNEEMKGRIIGREGRNIRSLEAALGVNIVIDDTPEVVVISGFDPFRREVARQSLEQLIKDGRIHPTRIEEIVAKVQHEMEEAVMAAGQEAVFALDLHDVHPDVVKLVGRLKFRHSYGQNVLQHSVEMARIMGSMAAELGLDTAIARRIGLFHDLGKALDQDAQGSHAVAGGDFLRKHGESDIVCNAVGAHHEEVPAESIYAALTKAGDAITASRPGARSETTEVYIQRLEKLEGIANSFPGVTKSYAVQAGREIRVIVEPQQIDDNAAAQLARSISQRIEDELDYPGKIQVTVVRETRCIDYAR